jgi:polyisoprenoid-binding protein YceI
MASMPDRSVRFRLGLALAVAVGGGRVAQAEPRTFVLDPAKSRVLVHVGKAGLFKFAGHEHDVAAPLREGEVVADPADPARGSVRVAFDAAALEVVAEGEPPEDVPKVQETMAGPGVLAAAQFPEIAFESETVSGRETSPGVFELTVTGPLRLRDRSVRLRFSVRVQVDAFRLVASGKGSLLQSAFGISPISVAGVVKVKDELGLDFHFEGSVRQ